jgi:DNA-binding response OmpR family regulator
MLRILLVYEDTTELNFTQTFLKKIGLDCMPMSSEVGLSEKLLSFRPEVVVVSGRGSKVNAKDLVVKIRQKYRYIGRVIWLGAGESKPTPVEMDALNLDDFLVSPVTPIQLIEAFAKAGGIDGAALIEKLQRSLGAKAGVDPDQKRSKNYEQVLKNVKIDSRDSTIGRQSARQIWKKVTSDWDLKAVEEMNDLKRKFTEALFKKK